jgi:hypothetical protein
LIWKNSWNKRLTILGSIFDWHQKLEYFVDDEVKQKTGVACTSWLRALQKKFSGEDRKTQADGGTVTQLQKVGRAGGAQLRVVC